MKLKYKLPAFIMLVLLAFVTFQCAKEQNIEAVPQAVSTQQLANDTSFVKMVEVKMQISGILYRQLRSLGSDKARQQQNERIAILLNQPTQANLLSAIQKMGFESSAQFVTLTSVLSRRKNEVQGKFKDYSKLLDDEKLAEAYQLSFPLKGVSYTQHWIKDGTSSQNSYGEGQFCPDCHYNNCDECNGGGGGGGGGGNEFCSKCYSEFDALLTHLNVLLYSDVEYDCGSGVYYDDNFLQACFGNPTAPNQAPACQAAACAANAFHLYMVRLDNAERGYGDCVVRYCR